MQFRGEEFKLSLHVCNSVNGSPWQKVTCLDLLMKHRPAFFLFPSSSLALNLTVLLPLGSYITPSFPPITRSPSAQSLPPAICFPFNSLKPLHDVDPRRLRKTARPWIYSISSQWCGFSCSRCLYAQRLGLTAYPLQQQGGY